MSNDSVSCKYQGSKVFIDYFIGKYLEYRLYVLFALTYHVPAQRYRPIFPDIRQRKERLHNVGEQDLVVETTVITCFSDQTVDDNCLHRMIL